MEENNTTQLFWMARCEQLGGQKTPIYPIVSMYGLFTYIQLIRMVNVGKYTIHGYYGFWFYQSKMKKCPPSTSEFLYDIFVRVVHI